uniref:Uncharacterized protein n=1 Tax=Anopheles funestus TaxID=62324 RepID=A0A182RV65_ANOFN
MILWQVAWNGGENGNNGTAQTQRLDTRSEKQTQHSVTSSRVVPERLETLRIKHPKYKSSLNSTDCYFPSAWNSPWNFPRIHMRQA